MGVAGKDRRRAAPWVGSLGNIRVNTGEFIVSEAEAGCSVVL